MTVSPGLKRLNDTPSYFGDELWEIENPYDQGPPDPILSTHISPFSLTNNIKSNRFNLPKKNSGYVDRRGRNDEYIWWYSTLIISGDFK